MNNILVVYGKPEEDKNARFGFSLNLLYIATILKKEGYNITLKDYSKEKFNNEEFYKLANRNKLMILEIDSFALKRSLNYSNSIKLMRKFKQVIGNKVVAFGYDLILDNNNINNVDYSIKFECEKEISNIVKYVLQGKSIEQIDSKIKHRYVTDLDEIIFPERSMLSHDAFYSGRSKYKSTLIQTARGCNNSCSFCQRKGWNIGYRMHSIDYVLEEFKIIKENNYKNVWITDENFTYNLKRSKQLLNKLYELKLTENMKLFISSWTNIDKEFLDIAKKANVSIISFGLESTSKDILDFYNKKIDFLNVSDIIKYANNIGIFTVGNFIIGAPMENNNTINNTFNYILNTPIDEINIKILNYMKGSTLFEMLPDRFKDKRTIFACKENGLCSYTLEELKQIKTNFMIKFKNNRKKRYIDKIKKFGLPYFL